jgi:hypothetical protein
MNSDLNNKPIVVLIGVVASLIAIIVFITGKENLAEFFSPQSTTDRESSFPIRAQPYTVNGTWRGILSQRAPVGPAFNWNYVLSLEERDGNLYGTATLENNGVSSSFDVQGTIDESGEISLVDMALTYSTYGWVWCIKSLSLQIDSASRRINGEWTSNTYGCMGGRVDLSKQ